MNKKIIEKAKTSIKESKDLDFKVSFDINSKKDWCEIIKDIIAISNTSDGILLFGVDDNGQVTEGDYKEIFLIDPATITDKITTYTNITFSNFEIIQILRDGITLPALYIFQSDIPTIFSKPGDYSLENGKQKSAFAKGTLYFRHGAKSEPANQNDIHQIYQKWQIKIRNEILNNIQHVIEAPEDHKVYTFPKNIKVTTMADAVPVRLTDTDDATPIRIENPDEFYPLRQMDIIKLINDNIGKNLKINNYDIYAVRTVFNIDENKKYYFKSKFGSPQYSNDFIGFILKEYNSDNKFFKKTREQFKNIKK